MEIVRYLIASGADVKATDPDGFTPLHWAASAGKSDAAKALIAAGADPNALGGRGANALEAAFYGRHPEAVEALLQGGLKVETKGDAGRALLHRAASAGFLSLVEYLLKNGRKLYLLAEGRLVNLSAAEGHPSEVMDMSFSNQALCVEHLAKKPKMEPRVYNVPREIDELVARLKLNGMNVENSFARAKS
jgi:ankyrin repeat protein